MDSVYSLESAKRSYRKGTRCDTELRRHHRKLLYQEIEKASRAGKGHCNYSVPVCLFGPYAPYSVDEIMIYLLGNLRSRGYSAKIRSQSQRVIKVWGWKEPEEVLPHYMHDPDDEEEDTVDSDGAKPGTLTVTTTTTTTKTKKKKKKKKEPTLTDDQIRKGVLSSRLQQLNHKYGSKR